MALSVIEYEAPAHWASALINGDTSGLDEGEARDLDAWCESMGAHDTIVSCADETRIGGFYFRASDLYLRTDLVTYTALRDSAANALR